MDRYHVWTRALPLLGLASLSNIPRQDENLQGATFRLKMKWLRFGQELFSFGIVAVVSCQAVVARGQAVEDEMAVLVRLREP